VGFKESRREDKAQMKNRGQRKFSALIQD